MHLLNFASDGMHDGASVSLARMIKGNDEAVDLDVCTSRNAFANRDHEPGSSLRLLLKNATLKRSQIDSVVIRRNAQVAYRFGGLDLATVDHQLAVLYRVWQTFSG